MGREPDEKSKDVDLHAEIRALRREVAELRARRSTGDVPQSATGGRDLHDVDKGSFVEEGEPVADELRALIEELAESVETGISKRPVAYVFGALLAGILIGRMLSR